MLEIITTDAIFRVGFIINMKAAVNTTSPALQDLRDSKHLLV